MESGIYCIENIENGKMYIGKGANLKTRMWDKHQGCLAIESAIKKYGDAIIRYPIQYCEPIKEELDYWEKYFIKEWNTKSPNGYNLTDGGDGLNNPSEETREKMKNSQLGEKNHNYGIPKSPEIKKKMSVARLGTHPSEKTKEKQRQIRLGTHSSDETKKKLSVAFSGENHPQYGKTGKESINYARKSKKEGCSKYRGVSINKFYNKNKTKQYTRWRARYVNTYIGSYGTEIDAANAVDKYIIEHNIEDYPLNFPDNYKRS